MRPTDPLRRLEMPNENVRNEYVFYEMRMQPRMEIETPELEALYRRHEAELLEMAEREARKYLESVGAWDCEPGEAFPCGAEMTGEWYVGSVFLDSEPQVGGYLEMRFTASYPPPTARPPVDDYLEMDCWFFYRAEEDRFVFDCFNTAAI